MKPQLYLTRFAPSPTGYLHVGNVRTALICYLYAKSVGGKFLLRIDDTDTERSKEKYVKGIKEDLSWLGIDWDLTVNQSDRFDSYKKAVEKLRESGRIYPCYETQEELAVKRKMQLSRGIPPIYDREGLSLTTEQKKAFEKEGRKPHYRFFLEDKETAWSDEIKGSIHFSAKHSSDPILIRENGIYTYMLPSTVDDIELNVTHVIRGEDHVSNTAIQIQIFEALGGNIPTFAHNALIKTAEGKLSKRKGTADVASLRRSDIDPMAINSFLAKIGTSDPIEIRESLNELINEFDITKFGRSQTLYSLDDIIRLNTKLLHTLPFEKVKHLGISEDFWLAIRPNLSSLQEIEEWQRICSTDIVPLIDDIEFTTKAAKLLPEKIDENTWSTWIGRIKESTDRKGKNLFMPLRKALTGMDNGPELKNLLPLIGRDKIQKRLVGHL